MPGKRAVDERSDSEEAVSSQLLSGGQTASAAKVSEFLVVISLVCDGRADVVDDDVLQRARISDVIPTQDTARSDDEDDEDGDIDDLAEPEQDVGTSSRKDAGMRLQIQEEDLNAEDEGTDEDDNNSDGNTDEEEDAQIEKAAKAMKGRQRGVRPIPARQRRSIVRILTATPQSIAEAGVLETITQADQA